MHWNRYGLDFVSKTINREVQPRISRFVVMRLHRRTADRKSAVRRLTNVGGKDTVQTWLLYLKTLILTNLQSGEMQQALNLA